MKAIVANALFGSILSCLSWADSACAKPQTLYTEQFKVPVSPVLSAKMISSDTLPVVPQIINLVDRIFTVNKSNTSNFTIDQEAQIVFRDRFNLNLNQNSGNRGLILDRLPYTYQDRQADLILGFQNPFWSSGNQNRYWGVTTVEHWGNDHQDLNNFNLARLNYANLSPTLASGDSTLIVSGGGMRNLAEETNTSREFEHFRGGISYRHGVAKDLTMGAGFVYDNFLVGFTQLTYNSDRFPLKTTVSLLARESGVDFRSYIRFQPTDNFVLNYYHDYEKDKFDASWQIVSGLSLIADGDTKQGSLSTGIKVAVQNDYMSISAKAALNNDNKLQWKLNSRIGGLKFNYGNDNYKSTSEIEMDLVEPNNWGFHCSAFVKYENLAQNDQDGLTVWGSKLYSTEKITPDQNLWAINLGYGSSYHGNGLIVSGSFALKPDLFLKLTYQEISATSDDTKIKLQISSK
jgi:hypothetical protein